MFLRVIILLPLLLRTTARGENTNRQWWRRVLARARYERKATGRYIVHRVDNNIAPSGGRPKLQRSLPLPAGVWRARAHIIISRVARGIPRPWLITAHSYTTHTPSRASYMIIIYYILKYYVRVRILAATARIVCRRNRGCRATLLRFVIRISGFVSPNSGSSYRWRVFRESTNILYTRPLRNACVIVINADCPDSSTCGMERKTYTTTCGPFVWKPCRYI